ncbi:MAG: hypothetical protein AMS15_00430 [Planctomycetes bacterium DG_23]|nr:MAG: hypothetical protein AMS15_00430 [Planctomycetes bacterium DG_23]
MARKILNIAHRGWSAEFPENTLSAFRAACELGVDMVEVDVRLTNDGELVAMHDREVSRTTNGKGSVSQLTLKQIKSLDAGSWFDKRFSGEKVPTLKEVLDVVSGKSGILMEVKGPGKGTEQVIERILELADGFPGPLIVQSFNSRFLAKFKERAPQITTGICSRQPDIVQRALKARCQGIHFGWLSLAATALGAARKHGLQIFAWTAKRRRDIEIILHLDVDGIITDCPDVLKQRLKSR